MDKKQNMIDILSDRDILSLFKNLFSVLIIFNIVALFILINIKSNSNI